MATETPVELWHAAVASDPSRPFVTFHDESGGRVELSFATFDNWVNKTANMLVDGLGAQPGDRVALALPVHWQSLVWLLACWSTDTTAVLPATDEVPPAEIAVTDAPRVEAALDTGAHEVVGTSLHPLGAPMPDCPPPAVDYAVEVRSYGDHFTPPFPPRSATTALRTDTDYSAGALVAAARARAEEWELTSQDRVAIDVAAAAPLTTLGLDASRFLCPVLTKSPVMLTSGINPAKLYTLLEMERVTAIACVQSDSPTLSDGIRPLT